MELCYYACSARNESGGKFVKPHIIIYYLTLFGVAAVVAASFINLGKALENQYLAVEQARRLEIESSR